MSKAILEFNLPEEKEDFETAVKAFEYRFALEEVHEQLFRPRNKHGYSDPELQRLASSKNGQLMLDILAKMYFNILEDRNLNI